MADDLELVLKQVADDFRRGATAAGNERFAAISSAIAEGVKQDDARANSIVQFLREALQRHERGDYIGLADVLEHELLPEL